MKTALLGILSVALLFVATSCGNYVYRHSALRTPMLEKKNDINAQINVAGAGTEFYGAWSPINNFAFSLGYAVAKDTSGGEIKKHEDIEICAIPYYADKVLRLEMPCGYAMKHTNIPNGDYARLFFQPSVGASWDVFDIAFITRYTYIQYAYRPYMTDNRFEAGLMMKAGYKYVKFMLQFTISDGTRNSQMVDYWPFHVGFGLNFKFNTADFQKSKPVK
jgi:hypothetical protein